MAMRARRLWGTAMGAVALSALVLGTARSPSARASFHAAYRAFRNPALLDPPPPPAPLAPLSCARFADDGKQQAPPPPDLDADITRTFERPPAPIDLDDPDGAALSTLTLPDLHVPITRRTLRYLRFFTKTEAGRTTFLQRYRRGALYRESVAHALREAGLPEDLMWLAAIESGFDARAVSPAGAAGIWQFMPETGQLYGLDQSPWVDERRSIVRATAAAVTHLRDLHERFGRWDLALAAYNAGYDRIAGAMERVVASRGPTRPGDKPISFADLAAARALPEETINYVPQIVAFALVAANRSRFGLDMPELTSPLDVGEIAVPAGTRLRTIARAAGISVNVLREYNPQLLRDRVPPIGGDYLVALPESRVQRALAAFPAYSEQEVVAQNDDTPDPGDPVASAVEGLDRLDRFVVDPDADEPLPRRPPSLGKNRLPSVALPGRERSLMGPESFGLAVLTAKLPASLAIPDIGWRRSYMADPLGVLASNRSSAVAAKAGDTAIQKQLGFLHESAQVEPLRAFPLGNGIMVRVRRDKGAPGTAITVRVATLDEADGTYLGKIRRGAEAGSAETLHTITVGNADADAGVELASTRLRLALGDTSAAQLAAIRFRAGNARRRELQKTPYGPAWIALGEALFPPEHSLAGTVLGAASDGGALRDMMVAEAMRREHAVARASITVVGDVDELRVKKLAESFLGSINAPFEAPILPHPRDDRLTVEDNVGSPRVLVGWIGPGEGEVGDASLRVLIEMLENSKTALLSNALGDAASQSRAEIEIWPRASVPTIEIAPSGSSDVHAVLARLEAELNRLATEGPDGNSVAVAKWILHARLQKEAAAAHVKPNASGVHSAGLARLRHALRPWAGDRARKALDEVSVSSIRAVVRRVLSPDHRVVVTTVPRAAR